MARFVVARVVHAPDVRLRLRLPLRLIVWTFSTLRREELLDRLADLDLVGVGRDDERVDVVVVAPRTTSPTRPA